MKLSVEYLQRQYDFWRVEIGKKGIWDADKFGDVTFRIRPKNRSYNALFCRRWMKREGERVLTDRIIFYENVEDFDPNFIDNVLVHEMIHQYLIQNNIKGKTPHGPVFKKYMTQINSLFDGRLRINIKDDNPTRPKEGAGDTLHNLLIVNRGDSCYCCLINPAKLKEFNNKARYLRKKGSIESFKWAQSYDVYFERFSRCTRSLHGDKIKKDRLEEYIGHYNIQFRPFTKISSPTEGSFLGRLFGFS
ncbi:MAG: SprT-like domain-containing protein [Muribaculaceae bacterium]|nr:SprT-like domain-containing protein [Muribaculaceae bacterium]